MTGYFDFNARELVFKESLPVFFRHTPTERNLDDKQVLQERNTNQSVYLFCSRLFKLVEEFNQNKHNRGRLVSFLESPESLFITHLYQDWPREEYLGRLTVYINDLRNILNVESPSLNPKSSLDKVIEKITVTLKEVDYDLSRLRLENPRWVLNNTSFGKLLSNPTHPLFLIDNLDSFFKSDFEPASVFFILVPITNEQIELMHSRFYPVRIIYRHGDSTNQISSPYHSCMFFTNKIIKLAYDLENKTVNEETKLLMRSISKEMTALLEDFDKYINNFRCDGELNKLKMNYINKKLTALSHNVNNLSFEIQQSKNDLVTNLDRLSDYFDNMNNKFKAIGLLPETIANGCRNISENCNLYRVTKDNLFNENNLTAALLTWLKARLSHIGFHFIQEEPIANGRTDISALHYGQRVTVIESKLIQEHSIGSDIRKKINSGIYQLFSKYSDSIPSFFNTPPELYFVLFCYDPDYKTIREHIAAALDNISSEHSRLTIEHLNNFRYRFQEAGGKSPDRVVHVTIRIAPLRTKDNNDEKHGNYKRR